jgi:hypothetical protein
MKSNLPYALSIFCHYIANIVAMSVVSLSAVTVSVAMAIVVAALTFFNSVVIYITMLFIALASVRRKSRSFC